mgnify:CR=1 FL=1
MIRDLALTSNHCQRNWEDTPVEESKIQAIIDACTRMPTKQNFDYYELVVVTDPYVRQKIAKYSIDKIQFKRNETYPKHGNPQMQAPLLLLWMSKEGYDNRVDVNVSIGISSSAASLAAVEQGLATGFCQCVQGPKIRELLFDNGYIDTTYNIKFELAMGIGYPRKDMPHNHYTHTTRGGPGGVINTHSKNITVHRI